MTRRRVVLTITLTGPDSTGIPDQDGYNEIIREELTECSRDLWGHCNDLIAVFGLDLAFKESHLAQADDGALWETVAREGA